MQSVTSRIWTRVAVSISYDDDYHYTTGNSSKIQYTASFFFVNYYLLLFEFFTPELADGFSLEFEWLQVSSSLQDSSQYSSRCQ